MCGLPVNAASASIAVPSAEPESSVHGGTNTDEKWPSSRQRMFQSQFSPQPPEMCSGMPFGQVPLGCVAEHLEDPIVQDGGRVLASLRLDARVVDR